MKCPSCVEYLNGHPYCPTCKGTGQVPDDFETNLDEPRVSPTNVGTARTGEVSGAAHVAHASLAGSNPASSSNFESEIELLKVACEIEKYCREQSCGVLAAPPQGIVAILKKHFGESQSNSGDEPCSRVVQREGQAEEGSNVTGTTAGQLAPPVAQSLGEIYGEIYGFPQGTLHEKALEAVASDTLAHRDKEVKELKEECSRLASNFKSLSTQQTNCGKCGLLKHTPWRDDESLGEEGGYGYVCATCFDNIKNEQISVLQSKNGELKGYLHLQNDPIRKMLADALKQARPVLRDGRLIICDEAIRANEAAQKEKA